MIGKGGLGRPFPCLEPRRRESETCCRFAAVTSRCSSSGAADEIGWADVEDGLGLADSWSTYWYYDVMYVNGGLNRRGATANRGFEAYALYDEEGDRLKTRDWKWLNPQTQEDWQHPQGKGKGGKG